jgi:DNA polymerase IV
MRRVLHLDMDAFFASVELLRRPDLVGKPVVIGGRGDPNSRGVVSTCTYEARKFGVRSAMPMRTAKKLCPDAIFLPTDFAAYKHWSGVFKEQMRAVSPAFEDRGIDEAYIDVTDLPAESVEIGRELKQRVLSSTRMTCSLAIAPNKLLAKLGSELDKPDGLTILGFEDISTRIWPLDVRKLQGVGPKAEVKLKALGYATIGALAAVPLGKLRETFGESYSRHLHETSNGRDDRPVVTFREPKSRSAETTFDEDTRDWQEIARTLARLSKRVADELREKGYRARTVGIKLRFSDFELVTRDRTLEAATDDPLEIRRAAFECLGRVDLKKKVRLLGVRLTELRRGEEVTPLTEPDLLTIYDTDSVIQPDT